MIATTLVTSVVVAVAVDRLMKRRKGKNNMKVSGSYTASNCDQLHAFEGTNGKLIGGMNTKVNAELEKFYKTGKNPIVSKVSVTMDSKKMKVDWEVEISESTDGKAWVGFTSRGSAGNSTAFERAVSPKYGQDPDSILKKIHQNEPKAEIKKVHELLYNMSEAGKVLGGCATRQIFYAYTKPQKFPSL